MRPETQDKEHLEDLVASGLKNGFFDKIKKKIGIATIAASTALALSAGFGCAYNKMQSEIVHSKPALQEFRMASLITPELAEQLKKERFDSLYSSKKADLSLDVRQLKDFKKHLQDKLKKDYPESFSHVGGWLSLPMKFWKVKDKNTGDLSYVPFFSPFRAEPARITSRYGRRPNPFVRGADRRKCYKLARKDRNPKITIDGEVMKCFENHSGVDVASIRDINIYSAVKGKVVETGYSETGGNYIVTESELSDGRSVLLAYNHMIKINVKEGDEVNPLGNPIGVQGSVGRSTGAHLHLSLFLKEDSSDKLYQKDPEKYVPLRKNAKIAYYLKSGPNLDIGIGGSSEEE